MGDEAPHGPSGRSPSDITVTDSVVQTGRAKRADSKHGIFGLVQARHDTGL